MARAGRVGRAHGLDGSFYVDAPAPELLALGAELRVRGAAMRIARRAGTDGRPLVRLSGVDDREAAEALRGAELVAEGDAPAQPGEWDASELVGCEVPGLGSVRRVVAAPSCDLLEVGDAGALVPFVSDAIRRVDPAAGVIEADLRFLGLDDEDAS
jgi:16S rRNA processing protein RimM